MINDKLYTWIDVQDTLESYFNNDENQSFLESSFLHAYWDGVTINYCPPLTINIILDEFDKIFLSRFIKEKKIILLENGNQFPVIFEEVEQSDIEKLGFKPSIARSSFIGAKKFQPQELKTEQSSLFFAFHSFKGGVGRTLHALSFALHLAKKSKVLLIDADFEAPGLTWLVDNYEISLSDILALVHGSPESETENIIQNAAKKLSLNPLYNDKIYLLPAFRSIKYKNPVLEIKPEHIIKFSKNPFVLTNVIEKLAKDIGVDYIILDLRAGISELSAGWLLDPNIYKIFVTTLSSQSLLGTSAMFKMLASFEKQNNLKSDNNPFIIISQIPKASKKDIENSWSDYYSEGALSGLKKSYIESFVEIDSKNNDVVTDGEIVMTTEELIIREIENQILFSEEYDSLKFLPEKWNDVVSVIESTGLPKETEKIITLIPQIPKPTISNLQKSRTLLKDETRDLVYAEKKEIDDFLVTDSIRKLVQKNTNQLPIAVVVGAKGAGKTFLYKQLVRIRDWNEFGKIVDVSFNNPALIYPVTIPANMSAVFKSKLGFDKTTILTDNIVQDLQKTLKDNITITEWREKWLDYMAWADGYQVNEPKVGRDYIGFLNENGKKSIGVFDGLEEIFNRFNSNEQEQKAIQALIQDVPNWLESQINNPLGIIIFIRKDIVSAAILQNLGQFLDKHKEYELKWNATEALRLICWILLKFEILGGLSLQKSELRKYQHNELVNALLPLWGKRMAKDSSKEAFSYNWVLSSLANLKKEIQSRDIVRFLYFASEKSIEDKILYNDRLLFPAAIKKAIESVGIEKLDEVKKENEPLKIVLDLLQKYKTKDSGFPCEQKELNSILTEEKHIKLLEDNGVILLYNDEYYMSELYRQGMDFKYSRRGKPKVLYL